MAYKTVELIDMLKAAYHLPSDYAAAKKMGIKPSSVSRYRNKAGTLDDKIAFHIAELLDLNPIEVVASMHIERAERKNDKILISYWQKYAH